MNLIIIDLNERYITIKNNQLQIRNMFKTKNNGPIINGIRGDEFKNFIQSILKRGKIRQNIIDLITDDEGMELFDIAFKHKTADEVNNYEFLEFLGDSMVNTAIVWYLNRRFPKLRGAQGVAIFARLKINLISKKSFSDFAIKMDMWKFVSACEDVKNTKMKKTLEDVFEALFGAIAHLMEMKVREGTGYSVVSTIISSLFDEIEISLKYEDLFDAKTRLKELFDFHKTIGKFEYKATREEGGLQTVNVLLKEPNGNTIIIGQGKAMIKTDAEQIAAKMAIYTMNNRGITKEVSEEYRNLT